MYRKNAVDIAQVDYQWTNARIREDRHCRLTQQIDHYKQITMNITTQHALCIVYQNSPMKAAQKNCELMNLFCKQQGSSAASTIRSVSVRIPAAIQKLVYVTRTKPIPARNWY